MKKLFVGIFVLIPLFSFSNTENRKGAFFVTPSIEAGINLNNNKPEEKIKGEVAFGLDGKGVVFAKDKLSFELGAGLRQSFIILGNGMTHLNLFAQVQREIKDDLSFYTSLKLAPGVYYEANPIFVKALLGILSSLSEEEKKKQQEEQKPKFSQLVDLELGLKYKTFKVGIVTGGNFVKDYNNFRLNLKLGFDIPVN